ncbi:MAG: glycoside hydrolase family 15 protein, partial [Methanosarcinales archaeon]
NGMDKYLYNEKEKRFVRMIIPENNGRGTKVDLTLDASMIGIFKFGVYDPNDIRVINTMKAIKNRLWVNTEVGGIARYEDDKYHQVSNDIKKVPGNPWFICTLWLAEYYIAKAKNLEELKEALPILLWCCSHALESGVLAEQVHPYTGEPLSVSPLTWSHATFVMTVIEYLEKLQELHVCETCGRSIFRMDRAGREQHKTKSWLKQHDDLLKSGKSLGFTSEGIVKKDSDTV